MITNKLKINDSKTEFIVFRSPQLKCDLSGLSVNVGESMITQSSKVRDLGVIFDQFLNFDDHITAICRSTHYIINRPIHHSSNQHIMTEPYHLIKAPKGDPCKTQLIHYVELCAKLVTA